MQSFRIALRAVSLAALSVAASCSAPAPRRIPSWIEIEAVCGNPNIDFGCTETGRQERLARFGIPPLDKVRERKTGKSETGEFVVAMLETRSNAFALIFEHRKKYGPVVEIIGKTRRNGSGAYIRYVAPITEASWQEVTESGKFFDTPYFADIICVGGGATYAIESMDGSGEIRARVATPCDGGPVLKYFDRLSEIALRNLRQCAPSPGKSEKYEGYSAGILMDCVAGKR